MAEVYECSNDSCVLGSREQPGLFTGGMTADGKALLTGQPIDELVEGEDFGDGICPNCGTLAAPPDGDLGDYTDHTSLVGSDPLQTTHDQVAGDPDGQEKVIEAADELAKEAA